MSDASWVKLQDQKEWKDRQTEGNSLSLAAIETKKQFIQRLLFNDLLSHSNIY